MAEYEPFPTGANEIESDRHLAGRMLGCLGLGGLGLGAICLMAVLALSMLGSLASCEIDLGADRRERNRGTDSARLPVTIAPRTGLQDGSVVRVTSNAFEADQVVGVTLCLRSADTDRRGIEACDTTQYVRYAVDHDGRLDATFAVPRVITVGSQAYDCAASPKRCLVVAALPEDYDESGGHAISFEADLPPVEAITDYHRPTSDHLPIGAQPAVDAPVAAGTELTVLASGFQPGEPLLVAYCTSDLEDDGVQEACEPTDADDAVRAVGLGSVRGDFLRADGSGAFTADLAARATVTPFGDDLGKALDALDSTTTGAGPTTTVAPGPDTVACTAAEGGCSIVIAAAADTRRSAVLPYVVAS